MWRAQRGRLIAAALAIGVLAAWLVMRHGAMSACEREVRIGDPKRGAALCLASYQRTGSERDLSWAAKAYLRDNEGAEAARLARRLIGGPLDGDAHVVLGYVALNAEALREGRIHANLARAAHALAGDRVGMASDMVLLSRFAKEEGDFKAAVDAADEALRLARPLDDRHLENTAFIARADALRKIGDTAAAVATLTEASARATSPCDRTWVRLKAAMCRSDADEDVPAMVELAAAEEDNRVCGQPQVALQIATLQAWLLRTRDPAGALARLDAIAKSEDEGIDSLLLRAYLAADRGALDDAERYLVRAASADPEQARADADWQWDIACARAELSEHRGGLRAGMFAEVHYRRSISMVAALRATARDWSAFLLARHRRPYDGLIALLARAGRWRDALAVVLELDASDMLRATAAERFLDAGAQARARASPVTAASADAVLAAWQARDLAIVIAPSERGVAPGGERVYRLHLDHGRLTGEDVGDAKAARIWADALFADPGQLDAARALGRMVVPRDHSTGTLDVLAIGALARAPLAALRDDDGAAIVGRRPLARVLGLRATRPAANGDGGSMVIADPRGDLPGAGQEGVEVARALGSGAQLSGAGTAVPATRAQLWAAHDARLLHVAAHVGAQGRWRALYLADGDVDPAEIVEHGLAPRLAVLASCGSAAALDEEGRGSIAAALLEAGTSVVIATDRSVGDQASLAMMRAFYAQADWRADPARALARVQAARDAEGASRASSGARSWAAFTVLARPPLIDEPAPSR